MKLELFFGDRVKYLEQTVHDSFVKNISKTVLLAQVFFAELDCDFGKKNPRATETNMRETIVLKQM